MFHSRKRQLNRQRRRLLMESLEGRRVFDVAMGAELCPPLEEGEGVLVAKELVRDDQPIILEPRPDDAEAIAAEVTMMEYSGDFLDAQPMPSLGSFEPRPDDAEAIGPDATALEFYGGLAWVSADLASATDRDAFKLTLPALSRLALYSAADNESGAVNVTLYDSNMNALTGTTPEEFSAEVFYPNIAGGEYYLLVEGGGDSVVNYWLSAAGRRVDDSGVPDESATVISVEGGYGWTDGVLEQSEDVDAFQIKVDATDYFAIYAAPHEEVQDFQITVQDAEGNLLQPLPPTEDSYPFLTELGAITGGVYYVTVSGLAAQEVGYDLSIAVTKPEFVDIIYLPLEDETLDLISHTGVEVKRNEGDDETPGDVFLEVITTSDLLVESTDVEVEPVGDVEVELVGDVEVELVDDVPTDGIVNDWIFQTTGEEDYIAWQNTVDPMDVNRDTAVTTMDLLLVINRLNNDGITALQSRSALATEEAITDLFYDVDADRMITPMDALLVINRLNREAMLEFQSLVSVNIDNQQEGATSSQMAISSDAFDDESSENDDPVSGDRLASPGWPVSAFDEIGEEVGLAEDASEASSWESTLPAIELMLEEEEEDAVDTEVVLK